MLHINYAITVDHAVSDNIIFKAFTKTININTFFYIFQLMDHNLNNTTGSLLLQITLTLAQEISEKRF